MSQHSTTAEAERSARTTAMDASSGDSASRRDGGPVFRLTRRGTEPSPAAVASRPRDVNRLDDAQREVVAHRGGPLAVLAGPGTGKTTTLVEVVADRVLNDQLAPERVLVLTFGRRAAAELRDRIAARIGRTSREPVARTFHSYAFGLLRREAVAYGEPTPRLLSGPEQDLMIRELLRGDIEEFGLRDWPLRLHDALPTRGFAEELRSLLLRAAERGITPKQLRALARRYKRPDWLAAGRFAEQYAAVTALRPEAPVLDPAELVMTAARRLASDPRLLEQERADRSLVVVDEYQDADPAQEELLSQLAGDGRDLIVVGDPDQSIYGFRGADVSVLRNFPERFRNADGTEARTIALRTSRRSGPTLLAASRRVANRLGGASRHRDLRVPDNAADLTAGGDGEVEVHLFRTHNQEAAAIAHRLREAHLTESVPWSRMAVLVRGARQLGPLRRALSAAGVPIAVRLEEVPLVDQPAVRPLLQLLALNTGRATLAPERAVELLTGTYGGADPLGLRRLRQGLRARSSGRTDADALIRAALATPELLDGLETAAAAPARRIAALLAAGRDEVATESATAETVLWRLWSTANVSESWAATAASDRPGAATADRDLDAVTALFDLAARFCDRMPAAGPAVFLDHVLGQEIPADTLAPRAPEGEAVTLLTAHASKGLEWDVVAIAGVQDGVWPDLRIRGTLLGSESLVDAASGLEESPVEVINRLLAEERRLFYVAVTRARRRLLVSAVSAEEDQPSRFLDELSPLDGDERPFTKVPRGLDLASVTAQLRAVCCDGTVEEPRRRAAAYQLARLAAAGVRGADPSQWYALPTLSDDAPLHEPDETVRVSPSKVEAFQTCALRWLLESSGGTRRDGLSQNIGNLVHELAYDVARGELSPDELPDAFEERWSQDVDAGTGWHARKEHDRALAMVRRLQGWLRDNPRELVAAEEAFGVRIGRAWLSGRVDRLERDTAGNLVVVDLKTSRSPVPKSQVEQHAQLGAYQVAVERGGFDADGKSGGAALVQLGHDRKRDGQEQRQQALVDAEDPQWAERMVSETAEGMASSEFQAVKNPMCRHCVVRSSCPLHTDGGQVTP